MFEDTCGFLDIGAAILGARFQDFRKLALPHDDVHFPANAGIRKQLLDIHQPGLCPVDFVFARAIAEHAAGNGYLGVLDGQRTIGIIDGERDLGPAQLLAVARPGEDDVLHLAAAQGFRAGLSHDPGKGINNVGFAGTVRADNSTDARLKFERRRRRE